MAKFRNMYYLSLYFLRASYLEYPFHQKENIVFSLNRFILNFISNKQIENYLLLAKEETDSIKAYNFALKAQALAESMKSASLVAESSLVLSEILISNGVYNQALIENSKALDYFTKIKNPAREQKCWRITAIIYGFLGDFEKQIIYYNKCLKLLTTLKNPIEELQILNNIGYAYLNFKKFNEAQKIFYKNYFSKNADNHLKCVSLKNLAIVYYEKEYFSSAKKYLKKTIQLGYEDEQRNLILICAANYYIGKIYFLENKYPKAYKHISDSLKLSLKTKKFHKERLNILECLIEVQLALGLKNELPKTFKEYKNFNTKINTQFLDNSIKTNKFKLEINEIERERNLLSEQNELLKKANRKIEKQKADLEEKSKLLSIINADLKTYAHVIAHDLKQPIRTVSNFIGLLELELSEQLSDKNKELMGYIKSASNNMSKFVTDILEHATVENNLSSKKCIDCNLIIEQVKLNLQNQIDKANAILKHEKLPNLEAHESSIIQIFQNIISNAIKFRKPDEQLIISLTGCVKNNYTIIEIKDNGIGIEKENKEKIFQLFTRLNKKSEYEGSGIGLSTVLKLIKKYNGKIEVESELGIGTEFILYFPI